MCFSCRSQKQDGHPGLWLAETCSTSPLKPLNRIQRNLIGSKISTPSTKFVFFRPIRKTWWLPWPLIGWDIFNFSVETAEWNSTKLDGKQDLNALYQVCVFRADRKNKMAALASDWLRHFWLLWNRWMEFNETWQEARSQQPLSSLCFSGWSEKQDGRSGLWLADTFSTSPLKPLNGIQRNLTGSKISTPSTKFVFWTYRKKRWPPWPLIGWDIFDFSSETAEPNSTKLDRKQDLNVLYQVCVFQADRKKKMAALASDWLRHFRLLWRNRWREFNETWQEARSFQCLLQHLCFSGQSGKTKWQPWPLICWDIFDFSSETTERNLMKVDRKQNLNALTKFVFFRWIGKTKWPPRPMILLRHFQLFLWNSWIEFNKTWQEARSQHRLPGLRFWGWSEKQDSRPVLWLAVTFSTSTMKPLNGIQRNLTESKFSTSSTKFLFFGLIQKKWPPWPLIGWDIFWLFLWNPWTEFSETWQEARS